MRRTLTFTAAVGAGAKPLAVRPALIAAKQIDVRRRPDVTMRMMALGTQEAFHEHITLPGDTLKGIAEQHKANIAALKEVNGISSSNSRLEAGRKLLVPVGRPSRTSIQEGQPSYMTGHTDLWVGSNHVEHWTVSEAEALYLRACERANEHHTLLVLYAPWCPHSSSSEREVERLAAGLSHVRTLRIVALNGDSPQGRLFAKDVLGVSHWPSLVVIPAHSSTLFKYKGHYRNAESLLRFLNMTCCARGGDGSWALRSGSSLMSLVPAPVSTAVSDAGMLGVAVLGTALLAAGAATWWLKSSPGALAADSPLAEKLDWTLAKMQSLLPKLKEARARLFASQPQQHDSNHSAAAPPPLPAEPLEQHMPPEVESQRMTNSGHQTSFTSPPVAADSTTAAAAEPAAAPSVAQIPVALQSVEVLAPDEVTRVEAAAFGLGGGKDVGGGPDGARAPPSPTSPPPPSPPPPPPYSAEGRSRVTKLTDDELIALVNAEPNLEKVLNQLLKTSKASNVAC